jgi:DNA-binding transcriptional MerR regulator
MDAPSQHPGPLPTTGVIADRLGVKTHQVAYVVRTRRISPSGRAGRLRVFSEQDVALIQAELEQINARAAERGVQ